MRCFLSLGSPAGHTINNRHVKCVGETRTSLTKKSVATSSVEQAHGRRGHENQDLQEQQRQRHENHKIRCGWGPIRTQVDRIIAESRKAGVATCRALKWLTEHSILRGKMYLQPTRGPLNADVRQKQGCISGG